MRLEIDVPAARAEAAAAVAWAVGAQGVAVRDASTGDAPPGRAVVCLWLPEEDADAGRHRVAERLGPLLPEARLRLVPERADWRPAAIEPVSVAGFTLVPLDDGPPATEPPVGPGTLRLEPGSAFGGGTHPTTVLCARAIEAAFERDPAPRRVLDVGTGTGVLALMAAARGAAVAATDIDPLARRAARRHAVANGLADRIEVGEALPPGPFDLVVANLYLGPLSALAPALAARLAPRGRCVVSGITVEHRPTIERAFAAAALAVADCAALDGWIALTLAPTSTPEPP